MRVQAATRPLTDVGGCRGAEGKPSRSQPAGVSRDLLAALSDERHGDPRKVTGSSQRSPLPRRRVGSVPAFQKMRVNAGDRGFESRVRILLPPSGESLANLT